MVMTKTKYTGVYYRDNLQHIRVYYIQYKNNGKLIRQKVGTKAEGISPIYCKKLRDQTLVNLRLGEDAPIQSRKSIITLDTVANEYFDQSEARSIKKLKSVYSTHIHHLKDTDITTIDADTIDALRRKKSKLVSAKTNRVLAPKTVNNILATLSAILHFAQEKKYIHGVPKIKKNKTDNTRERFLSKNEIKLLLSTLEGSELPTKERLLIFVKISLSTGARLGSVLSIKGKDINRANRTITLQNHKTDNTYTAFIPTGLMELIPPLEPQEKLIDIADAKQIQRPLQGVLNNLFNVGLNAEDRKDRVVIHTLRHTFASHLAINGTPIQTIMKLMDHSDIKMTLKYAKLMPDTGRDDVENLYG